MRETRRVMMTRSALRLAAAFVVLGALLPLSLRADEARTMSGSPKTFSYVHLYSDANGVSHFREENLALQAIPGPHGDDHALSTYTFAGAQGAQLLALKQGAREDWHTAPRRMFLIVLQGMSEVTASDGEVRRFGPGSMLLMDDLKGKGHITQAVGGVDHVALTIPAPAD
jgi:hypothetical protein